MKQKDVLHLAGLLIYLSTVIAVPVSRHTRDIFEGNISSIPTDECVSEDIIYKAGDEVPSPGPCEQCLCQPPKVECTMIKCKTNSGCKMIQRANHCCPDYMCDCEYKGQVYNNGERLELEDTPCQVCYCKGGEIMCTSITCYERTDCEPKYVSGQCCPRYDHCPLETSANNSANSTVVGSKREIQPWLMTKAVTVKPIAVVKQTTMKPPEEHTPPNVYPQTLKIHEILPTTVKYDRFPNGKRPVLSTVSKPPQEIYEKGSSDLESSTLLNADIIPSSSENGESEIQQSTIHSQYSSTLDSTMQPSSTEESSSFISEIDKTDVSTPNVPTENVDSSEMPVEYITVSDTQEITTENSQSSMAYEFIAEDGPSEHKEHLVDRRTTLEESVTPEMMTELEGTSTTKTEMPLTEYNDTSTEGFVLRDRSELEMANTIVTNGELTPTADSLPTYDIKLHYNANEKSENIESLDATSSSFTQEMESLVLAGGIYDELNDTIFYAYDNDVKQEDESDEHNDKSELMTTTERYYYTVNNRSESEPATPVLSDEFETFMGSERSEPLSIRRNDDWPSDSYQRIPGDSSDADEILTDLNVGATSHSETRVSPSYYFGSDTRESYVLNGRSLAPFNEKNSKDNIFTDKAFSLSTKFHTGLNSIVTEEPILNDSSETFESKLAHAISQKFNPDEHNDLYLSITGKNSSSNETILHMVLSPEDLKYLAEQLVKENIKSQTESVLKETEVKIEWLTKDQLSQIKPINHSSKVNINLIKCNFTGQVKSKSEKIEMNEGSLLEQNDVTSDTNGVNSTVEIVTEMDTDTSAVRDSTLGTIVDTSSPSYSSTDKSFNADGSPDSADSILKSDSVSESESLESEPESESLESVTESDSVESVSESDLVSSVQSQEETSKMSVSDASRSKKQHMNVETSTIRVYEIRPTEEVREKLIEPLITTDGPYTSDNSTSENLSSPQVQSDEFELNKSNDSNEKSSTDEVIETSTNTNMNSNEKPRKKNLPDVEPFLRQLPSTLDEKDVSILRDFLEKHLSDTPNR